MRTSAAVAVILAALLGGCAGADGTPTPSPRATAGTAGPPSAPAAPASPPSPAAPSSPAPSAAAAAPASTSPARTATDAAARVVGTFDVALAPEASGLVASRRDPDLLWLVDDGPGTDRLVAVDRSGALRGEVLLEGVDGRDVEDLAAGPCGPADPTPCLYVGDVGDNTASRADVVVHRLPEPDPGVGSAAVATARLTHPGGPVDVEALVVDAEGRPVLLTKEEGRTRLHAADAFADGALRPIAELALPEPALPLLSGFVGLTATAADLRPDGGALLVRTYDSVVELTAPPGGAGDLAGVGGWAVAEVPSRLEPQGEAVAYLPDGRGYATVSEGSGEITAVER